MTDDTIELFRTVFPVVTLAAGAILKHFLDTAGNRRKAQERFFDKYFPLRLQADRKILRRISKISVEDLIVEIHDDPAVFRQKVASFNDELFDIVIDGISWASTEVVSEIMDFIEFSSRSVEDDSGQNKVFLDSWEEFVERFSEMKIAVCGLVRKNSGAYAIDRTLQRIDPESRRAKNREQ